LEGTEMSSAAKVDYEQTLLQAIVNEGQHLPVSHKQDTCVNGDMPQA
jgi:hypothetical protein